MSGNPYFITGPALISFSGGRTSAFMLHEILRAHDGKLPDDVVVAFANTGKEREETLRFVHECGSRWGVRIRWVEYRVGGFEEVGFNSASRNGEPFEALIETRQLLPNVTMRYCTTKLKVDVMRRLMLSLGYERWLNAVGLRYDEGHRVLKQLARNDSGHERYTAVMPMASAKVKVTKRDVLSFWLGPTMRLEDGVRPQGFDLELQPHEGNCDLCFLKRPSSLKGLIRARPESAAWWIEREAAYEGKTRDPRMSRFNKAFSYAGLAQEVASQPFMPGLIDDEEYDVECGLHCAPESEAA